MVTSGELGIRSDALEKKLQLILDVAHTWGAVLLLDEADVFLEQRRPQDVSRNAMVSVFLRVLEYFQGILFLTTNQVQCFDEAFGSRIHLALKYGPLSYKAKRAVWKIFLDKCAEAPKPADSEKVTDPSKALADSETNAKLAATPSDSASSGKPTPSTSGGTTSPAAPGALVLPLTEKDCDYLASRQVNGRQIKNAVKMAQALAVNEGKPLGMQQIKKVLGVHESFTADWKGGDAYLDAMKTYV